MPITPASICQYAAMAICADSAKASSAPPSPRRTRSLMWPYGSSGGGASEVLSVQETGEDVFTAFEYVVYGTIGCYFCEPKANPVRSSIDNPDDPSEGPTAIL